MSFEEDMDAKVLQREEPLHGITPEEVEKMWAQFMDKEHHHLLAEEEEYNEETHGVPMSEEEWEEYWENYNPED